MTTLRERTVRALLYAAAAGGLLAVALLGSGFVALPV